MTVISLLSPLRGGKKNIDQWNREMGCNAITQVLDRDNVQTADSSRGCSRKNCNLQK